MPRVHKQKRISASSSAPRDTRNSHPVDNRDLFWDNLALKEEVETLRRRVSKLRESNSQIREKYESLQADLLEMTGRRYHLSHVDLERENNNLRRRIHSLEQLLQLQDMEAPPPLDRSFSYMPY
jgi:predicted RNase H-like nuclease (RuvC/YqgF family)